MCRGEGSSGMAKRSYRNYGVRRGEGRVGRGSVTWTGILLRGVYRTVLCNIEFQHMDISLLEFLFFLLLFFQGIHNTIVSLLAYD